MRDDGRVPPTAPRLPLAALLGRVQGRYVAEFERRLADAGYPDLSLAHGANVLRHLGTDEGVRVSALVARAGVSKQAVSQQVTHLVCRGYVVSEPDPDDQRAKTLRLTPRGAACQQAAKDAFGALERSWRVRYGDEQVAQLREVLQEILEEDPPAPPC